MTHWKVKYLFLLLNINLILWSNNIPLIDVVEKSNANIRWNPILQKGLIIKEDITISFLVESSTIIINNSKVVTDINFVYQDSNLYISKESAALIYRILKVSEDHETIVNDENLFNIPVIIIDPGHGGRDSGALGYLNETIIQEKDVVLDISKNVAQKLKEFYSHKKIIMTRDNDIFLTLEERVDLANNIEIGKKQTVIYISIHANASLNKNAKGFEVWYLPKDYRRNVLDGSLDEKESLSNIVNALKEDEISLEGQDLANQILMGMDNEIGSLSPNRGLKEEIWFVVRKARMASVLIEVGFVTNNEEGKRLTEPEYLQKVSNGIYNGIIKFISSYEKNIR